LAVIAANVQIAAELLPPQADALEPLRDAEQGVARVKDAVRKLKVFSSSNEEKRERVSLGPCLDGALTLVHNELKHRAQVVRELEAVPDVLANTAQLIQVFANLLTNAAHAIEEGHADRNTVTVRTRTTAQGRVAIEVQDTGSGIAPAVLPRIFEPFFTTRPQGIGSGLGLALCHGVVQKLGGSIEVETAEGKGSTFRVLLPPAPRSEAALPVAAAAQV